MGVVTWMVETTDNFLDDAAQTTFGNVAGQLGGVIAVASTLAVIGVPGLAALGKRLPEGLLQRVQRLELVGSRHEQLPNHCGKSGYCEIC